MKNLKYLLLLTIISCASPKVMYDYDNKEDFSKYKTFNFFKDAGEGLNEFDNKRVQTSIENQLYKQGFKKDSVADFYINFFAKEVSTEQRNTIGVGVGGNGRNVGFGISGGIPIGGKRVHQNLTIDFISGKTDQLFWQAVSESVLKEKTKPEDRAKHYQEILSKVFKGFPPKKESSKK